jgi:hypothetical protein
MLRFAGIQPRSAHNIYKDHNAVVMMDKLDLARSMCDNAMLYANQNDMISVSAHIEYIAALLKEYSEELIEL